MNGDGGLDDKQEKRLLKKLIRLNRSSGTDEFVVQELKKLYDKELTGKMTGMGQERKGRLLEIIRRIGDANRMIGKVGKAKVFYDRVLQEGPVTVQAADVHRILGDIERLSGNWKKATYHMNKSIGICKERKDDIRLAEAMRGLGYIFWRKGNYEKAMELFREAIGKLEAGTKDQARSTDAQDRLSEALIEVANVLSERGVNERALEYYSKALKLLTHLRKHDQISRVHNNIGHTFLAASELDRSMREFEQAARSARRAKDPRMLVWALLNMAEVHARKRDPKVARKLFEEAVEANEQVKDSVADAKVHFTLGHILFCEGQVDGSKKEFEESITMVDRLGTPHIVAYYSHAYGKVLNEMGDPRSAARLMQKSLKIFKTLGSDGYAEKVEQDLKGLG
jgi:tetratricopeptide (TPR) repeat protein